MLLSAVSILVVAQSSSEIPEGLMNNPVLLYSFLALPLQWGEWSTPRPDVFILGNELKYPLCKDLFVNPRDCLVGRGYERTSCPHRSLNYEPLILKEVAIPTTPSRPVLLVL